MEALSPGENQGATFTVRLPLAIIHDKSTPEETLNRSSRALRSRVRGPLHNLRLDGIKVLAVDDDADARELLDIVLSQCNADVRVVASAAQALMVLKGWRPDVIISDIGMPEEDGYSLIRKLRALPEGSWRKCACCSPYCVCAK